MAPSGSATRRPATSSSSRSNPLAAVLRSVTGWLSGTASAASAGSERVTILLLGIDQRPRPRIRALAPQRERLRAARSPTPGHPGDRAQGPRAGNGAEAPLPCRNRSASRDDERAAHANPRPAQRAPDDPAAERSERRDY